MRSIFVHTPWNCVKTELRMSSGTPCDLLMEPRLLLPVPSPPLLPLLPALPFPLLLLTFSDPSTTAAPAVLPSSPRGGVVSKTASKSGGDGTDTGTGELYA